MRQIREQMLPFERLTREPEQHFFGYYDLQPWSGDGRYHLCHRVGFRDRMQTAADVAELGVINMADGHFTPFSRTYAWNFQQGAMLQWHPGNPDEEVIFNTRYGNEYKGMVQNILTGAERVLPRPVAAVDPQGRFALSVNFSRMFDFRPGYGYAGIPDPFAAVNHPQDDGVFLIDLATGHSRLILPYQALGALFPADDWLRDCKILVNHITFNTDGSRFVFLLRNFPSAVPGMRAAWKTAILTAATDGSDVRCLSGFGMASHYHWRDPEHLLIWADGGHEHRPGLYLINDLTAEAKLVDPAFFTADGHCSYSPDRSKMLYDSYPDRDGYRHLYVYDLQKRKGVTLAVLRSEPTSRLFHVDMRCDLHPRWNREGTAISFDSVHEDHRHVYWMELPEGVV